MSCPFADMGYTIEYNNFKLILIWKWKSPQGIYHFIAANFPLISGDVGFIFGTEKIT